MPGHRYAPMKAVLTDAPFSDPEWVFERKLDGERCGAVRRGGKVTLLSRNQHDRTATFAVSISASAPVPLKTVKSTSPRWICTWT